MEKQAADVSSALADTTNQLNQFIQNHASQGMDAAMQAMLFAGKLYSLTYIYNLAFSALWMTIAAIVFVCTIRKKKLAWETSKKWMDNCDPPIPIICVVGICSIASVIFLINLFDLLNPISWAAAFDPKIALAAHLLKL